MRGGRVGERVPGCWVLGARVRVLGAGVDGFVPFSHSTLDNIRSDSRSNLSQNPVAAQHGYPLRHHAPARSTRHLAPGT